MHWRLFRICYLAAEIMEILVYKFIQIQTLSLQKTDQKDTSKWVLGVLKFIFVSAQLVYMCFCKTTCLKSYETLKNTLHILRTCLGGLSIFIHLETKNIMLLNFS